jgi:membrane fusion protein (multidrug efflux system)
MAMATAEATTVVERTKSEAPAAPAAATPAARATRKKLTLGAIGVAVVLGSAAYYVAHRGLESTDDAQTDADVVAVPARVSGTVVRVHFTDNQRVKRGDLLAELDDSALKAKLAKADAELAAASATAEAAEADAELSQTNATGNSSIAKAGVQSASAGAASFTEQIQEGEAAVKSAEANLLQAQTNRAREESLFATGAVARAQLDAASTAYDVASATLAGARARLATARQVAAQARSRVVEASARAVQAGNIAPLVRQAQARALAARAAVDTARATRDLAAFDLSYVKIVAPHDGVVSRRTINEGQTVALGQTIVQLVTPDVWVTANFKETQIGSMRVGQPARFTVDAFSGKELVGEVESFSGATGARFSLLPPDNATGNFTKVVQRVPVRIRLREVPAGVVLRPGMSVELTVDTRS